jgi:hypothetical protein
VWDPVRFGLVVSVGPNVVSVQEFGVSVPLILVGQKQTKSSVHKVCFREVILIRLLPI